MSCAILIVSVRSFWILPMSSSKATVFSFSNSCLRSATPLYWEVSGGVCSCALRVDVVQRLLEFSLELAYIVRFDDLILKSAGDAMSDIKLFNALVASVVLLGILSHDVRV